MPTLESDIQRDCVDVAKALGCLVFRMNAGRGRYNQKLAPAGTPDLLLITRNHGTLWVEVKKRGGELSNVQREMHEELRKRGEWVVTVEHSGQLYGVLRGVAPPSKL